MGSGGSVVHTHTVSEVVSTYGNRDVIDVLDIANASHRRDKLGMPITSLRDVLKIFDEEDQGTIIQPLATMIDKYIIQKILSQAEPSGWGALIATDLETAPGNIHDMLETAYQKPA